jgi:hypothetical protein
MLVVIQLIVKILLLLMQKPNWLILQMEQVGLDIVLVLVLAGGGFVLPITAIATALRTCVAMAPATTAAPTAPATFSPPSALAKGYIVLILGCLATNAIHAKPHSRCGFA